MGRVGWAVAALLGTGGARAQAPAPPTYALSWVRAEGAEECPSGRVVMAEIERRLGRRVFDVTADRAFEVELTRFGPTHRSDVFVRDAAGQAVGHRTLQSDEPGCTALVNATALAIALVIDPDAAAREPAPASSAAAFAPPAPPPQAAAPTPAAVPPPVAPASPPSAAPALGGRSSLADHPPAPSDLAELGLRAELSAGLVPAASPGVELSFKVRPAARWGFLLSAAYSASQPARAGIGALDVSLTRAAGLVTYRAWSSDRFRLALGAGPALGALHVAVRQPAPVTDPGDFVLVALQADASLHVGVTRALSIELGGSCFVPLWRRELLVRGQAEPVWQEPSVAGRGFFGVGMMLP